MKIDRKRHLERFYELLSSLEQNLGGTRKLEGCTGRMDWPLRGIYFFQEPGEFRSDTGNELRIVRVGTHALKADSGTKLWTRLSQHKGGARTGGGNHRGSIFRLIVGASLIERDSHDFPTWNKGSSAPREVRQREQPLEQAVSEVIGEMPFLWLAINDEPGPASARGYVERNAIGLLSNFEKESLDPPSDNWLGHFCNRERVRTSGLWNSNHVNEEYDPAFLDKMERLIEQMARAA
tara:strand:+ start:152 stop:859 length:708 start_codon:yes stop_codon:yes gene_type:complete